MKKIFAICVPIFVIGSPIFAMDPSSYETRLSAVETSVTEIQNVLNDKQDPDDSSATIPGLKTKVKTNSDNIETLQKTVDMIQQSIQSLSTGISSLSTTVSNLSSQIADMTATVADVNTRMSNLETNIDEKMNTSWEAFIEKKYQEYMTEKKKVLDILTSRKTQGLSTPTYITETADQMQKLSLEMRRSVLSDVLEQLNIFVTLLDDEKMESLQTYLTNTNVPEPQLKEVKEIMSGCVVDGEYLKVSGATRTFTRSAGFKTGLPKQSWMDQSCDYFAYGLRPVLEQAINNENSTRKANNAAVEKENALAQAAYEAGIQAAERVTFPSDDFTTLVDDYNRLLTRHEI